MRAGLPAGVESEALTAPAPAVCQLWLTREGITYMVPYVNLNLP